jgi:hypothetical protein
MRFFNQKEEVLAIELTPYGKNKFAKGEFMPFYYAFYDTGILYDGEYGDIQETQNQIENRITQETPRLLPRARFESDNQSTISLSSLTYSDDSIQENVWNSRFHRVLGSSDPNSEYYPSWNIRVLDIGDAAFDRGVEYMSENIIPQMSATLNIDYVTEEDPETGLTSFVLAGNDSVVFSVEEVNTIFKENGNFDIEVFVSSSEQQGFVPLGFINNNLENLNTLQEQQIPQNLLSTINGTSDEINSFFPVLNGEYVEFFLDIETDREISTSFSSGDVSPTYDRDDISSPVDICDDGSEV